ncbi:MAG TPA: DUF2878 domain-containing protein [Spongiibacteraceae bacterium]|jgi:hypothetical protein|nr:DUF2878 domain-containing protein [Spongiibacteraceae bacterium]HUH38060.1 DUF2878 domain-containing protein [Spongiibacteraceae bacterium]
MRTRDIVNACLFQFGWLASVLGGNPGALSAGLLALAGHWFWVSRSGAEWRFMAGAAVLGLGLDMLLSQLGAIRFNGALVLGLPAWLAVLWLVFLSTLNHALRWLGRSLWLAAAVGAVGGPLSYWAGIRLGAGSFGWQPLHALLAMAIVWALWLPALVAWVRRRPE